MVSMYLRQAWRDARLAYEPFRNKIKKFRLAVSRDHILETQTELLRPRTRSRPKNFGLETGRYRNFGRQIRSIHDSGFPTEPKRLDLIPKPRPKFRLRANGYQISASRPADTEILASGLKSKSKLWPQRFDLETETETETELVRSGPRMRPKFSPLIAVRAETLSLRPSRDVRSGDQSGLRRIQHISGSYEQTRSARRSRSSDWETTAGTRSGRRTRSCATRRAPTFTTSPSRIAC